MVVAINTVGMMGMDLAHGILKGVLGVPIGLGTIATMVSKFADDIDCAVEKIKKELLARPVVNGDETGVSPTIVFARSPS